MYRIESRWGISLLCVLFVLLLFFSPQFCVEDASRQLAPLARETLYDTLDFDEVLSATLVCVRPVLSLLLTAKKMFKSLVRQLHLCLVLCQIALLLLRRHLPFNCRIHSIYQINSFDSHPCQAPPACF